MSISFDKSESESVVRSAAAQADSGQFDQSWFKKVKRLSRLCEGGASKTHIAFLGTAMIAKAMRVDVDLLAIKPKHALDNPRAYSARILCEKVLVPLAAELGVSIGVTGRQPLNNQPYFRMTRLGDQTPVHPSGRAAFDYMVELVKELQAVSTTREARAALAAFIVERRRHQVRYDVVPEGESAITRGSGCGSPCSGARRVGRRPPCPGGCGWPDGRLRRSRARGEREDQRPQS